ncbi:MAG: polysulfide reductase NrfD [Gammaproteobacteria bacterium]|nr:polysulfide reductase NrfD [Gammaproteobacteria bacterium]
MEPNGLLGHLVEVAPYTGYVYPNETVIPWTVLIVVYPYLTGLVAGAFTVSSLYHVFGMERFKPVGQFALLTALAFMIFVPLPLLLHLGSPQRAFNTMITPHLTSAIAVFGFFASFYVILLALEIWFMFRPYMVQQAQHSAGLAGRLWHLASLGSDDVSPKAMRYDEKCIFYLAVIGIPAAHGLHGYVGFVFGSLKSREWWSSDLMPVVFLFSAVISGVALLIVLYVLSCRLRRIAVDLKCLKGLAYVLWGFAMFTLVLEGLEFANVIYKGREGIEMIVEYVTGPLLVPFFILQFSIGAVIPLLVLTYMIWRGTTGRALVVGVTVSALLVLFSVWMMRWNVVIGGQEIAKTGKGLLSYQMVIFHREGLVTAVCLVVGPLLLLWAMVRLLPPWGRTSTPLAESGAP